MARAHPSSYRRGLAVLFPDGGDVADETLAVDLYYLVDEGRRFVTPTEEVLLIGPGSWATSARPTKG